MAGTAIVVGTAGLGIGATMEDWINAGPGSIWTQTVKLVVELGK